MSYALSKILFHHILKFRGDSTSCSVYRCSLRYLLTNSFHPSRIFMCKMREFVYPNFGQITFTLEGDATEIADQIIRIFEGLYAASIANK